MLDRFYDFIDSLESPEGMHLALQNGSDRFDGIAILEFDGEGMFGEFDASVLLIILPGRLEMGTETSRSRLVTHITRERCGLWVGGGGRGVCVWWAKGLGEGQRIASLTPFIFASGCAD